jgi:neutral ceramidase
MMKSIKAVLIVLAVLAYAAVAQAELRAGVATADITPPIGGRMAGYSARGTNVSTGVHDPLLAKALVLKDDDDSIVMVTMDIAGFPGESTERVKQAVLDKTGTAQVMLLPSHTHSGPSGGQDFPSAEKPWIRDAERKIIEAIIEANGSVEPVKYGVGKGEVKEGHNRRKVNPDGSVEMFWRNPERAPTSPVDYMLGVIRFETLNGEPLATLVNFTCHPVVLGPENLLISADYPGVMTKTVEAELGGTCMFANGACGDINPFMDKTAPADGAYEEMEKMGKAVAAEVVRVSRTIRMHESSDGDLTAATETIAIQPRWDITDPKLVDALSKKYGRPLVKAYLSRFKLPMEGNLVTVTLGDDVAIAGLPGEFFVQHGLDLKKRCVIPNTFVFGYCNNSFGYFPTINAAWQGGYGGKEATIVEVGAGERFMNTALRNIYYQTGRLKETPDF